MSIPVFLTDGSGKLLSDSKLSLPVAYPLDSGVTDSFGRQRISQPTTLFDAKLIGDNRPLLWDDKETSGSGTSSTYSADRSDVKMETTASTAGTRVRQSFKRFNYFTAKSQVIFMTFAKAGSSIGMTKRIGYFEDNDGLFFQSKDGTLSFVVRSSTSGSAVDTVINQGSWNLDRLDGTGASGYTLDPDKGNILVIDFEWLGVGRVRFGFVIDGKIIYCHAVNNANNIDAVYMKCPNQPVRYEISNSGSGTSDLYMYAICASVSTEGEREKTGFPHAYGLDSVATLTGTTKTWAMLGLRLKTTRLNTSVILNSLQAYCTTTDGVLVTVHVDPTISGSPSWADLPNSGLQGFVGDGVNYEITGDGTIVYKFAIFGKNGNITPIQGDMQVLGADIDGTPNELVVGFKALTSSPKTMAFLGWRET